jgi:hypothetical protein
VNNARLTSAPASAITHAAPPGGLLVPANDAVIHKNMLPYSSSVAAAMFRRVLRRQPRVSVRSLVLAPEICPMLLPGRIAAHFTGSRA